MTVAWVFPGQGSQKIGMAKQIQDLPSAKTRFSYASELFERNLFEICELSHDSKDILNDLIIAAYNNAKENLKKKSSEELSKATGGLNLPLDFKLPF